MIRICTRVLGAVALLAALGVPAGAQQERIFRVDLAYRAPGNGPAPNFSPKGTQVTLTDVSEGFTLPAGAVLPAKRGIIKVGPNEKSWIPVLATADAAHPKDLCQIFLDRNRNGSFTDDGPASMATPTRNEKTGAWWSSFSGAEISIHYGSGPQGEVVEPYMVNLWIVREGETAPDILRYSVSSWRSGTTQIAGADVFVAAMDANNNAVFNKDDEWSVLEAGAPDAQKRVLSYDEARPTSRLMFVKTGGKELVLEFRSFVKRNAVTGYPTIVVLDSAGKETSRLVGYHSSKEVLAILK